MITEKDLREAIAECEGRRHPDASTCVKLAAFYTILNNMAEKDAKPERTPEAGGYSYQAGPGIPYGASEFSGIVQEKGIERVWPIIEETMDVLAVVEPKLYAGIIRKMNTI